MKGPSDALPNTFSLRGSIRTRLTYWNSSIHCFPYSCSVPLPTPVGGCWLLLPSDQMHFSQWHQCKFPRSPRPTANCTTAPGGEQTPSSHRHSDAGRPFAHPCLLSLILFQWKIMIHLQATEEALQKKKKTTFHSNLSETWGADQVTDGMGQHTPPPAAFGSLVQGTVPGVCGVCPPSWGTAKAQDRPKEEWCKTQGSRMAPGSLRYTLILCYITQHP